eukprot:3249037-Alexandrium_andersonii.AAC.1
MSASLVGSEMCIRDSDIESSIAVDVATATRRRTCPQRPLLRMSRSAWICLLYTSDAADDM